MKLRNLVVIVSFLIIPLVNGYAGLLDGIVKVIIPPCPVQIIHHNTPINTDDEDRHQLKVCPFMGGSVPFHDFKKDKEPGAIITKTWDSNAPKWRVHDYGSNLLGICKNSKCEAYNKEVVCGVGYGAFYVIKDSILKTTTKCPICNEHINPTTCAFNNCYYKVTGRRIDGLKTETSWAEIGDQCRIYNNDNDRVIDYTVLKIEAKRLSEKKPENEEI